MSKKRSEKINKEGCLLTSEITINKKRFVELSFECKMEVHGTVAFSILSTIHETEAVPYIAHIRYLLPKQLPCGIAL